MSEDKFSYYGEPPAGWSTIATVEWDGGYEWDQSTVFRKPNGALVGGHDSGCSCNGPFEGWGESDFQDVRTDHDIDVLVAKVYEPDIKSASEFRRKVRDALQL